MIVETFLKYKKIYKNKKYNWERLHCIPWLHVVWREGFGYFEFFLFVCCFVFVLLLKEGGCRSQLSAWHSIMPISGNLLSWESCLKHSRGYEGLYLYPELFGGFIHSNTFICLWWGGGLVRLLTVKAVLYVMSFILHWNLF